MDLTAHEAAAALHRLEDVEETLTARTAGLTHLVWALAAPLVFLTYGAAGPLVHASGHHWLFALLWLPAVLLGLALTHHLWHQHAVRMQWTGGDARSLLYAAIVLLAGAALWLLAQTIHDWSIGGAMTTANGLLALLLALVERRNHIPPAPLLAAGTGMTLAGLALTGPEATTALLGAAATALGWSLAGHWTLRRA